MKMSFLFPTFLVLFFLLCFSLKNGNTKNPKYIIITSEISASTHFLNITNHMCRLNTHEPVEQPNPMISPNFEFPVYEAEDEENEGIPDEISRLLE